MKTRLFALTALTAVVVLAVFAATAAARPIIGNVTGTPNTSFANTGGGGAAKSYDATVGFWSGSGFGSGETCGDDVLTVPIRINGNGGFTLNYQIRTQDILLFNWLSIYLDTPTGTKTLVAKYNPNPSLFSLYMSPVSALTIDTSPWKGAALTLRIVAHQDCGVAQFQALITSLRTVSNRAAKRKARAERKLERAREAIAPRKPPRSAPDRGRARAGR